MCTAVNIDLFRFPLILWFFGCYNLLLHKFATSVFRFRFCDAKLYAAILQHEKDFMHTYIHTYKNIMSYMYIRLKMHFTHSHKHTQTLLDTWNPNAVSSCTRKVYPQYFSIYFTTHYYIFWVVSLHSFHAQVFCIIQKYIINTYCIILFRCEFAVSAVQNFQTKVSQSV